MVDVKQLKINVGSEADTAVTVKSNLLGCGTLQTSRSLLMFQRNIIPPSSGLKSKPSK
jgi:hypothetical protein